MGYRELSKSMSVRERAEYLLSQGVEAILDISESSLDVVALPFVTGVGVLPCGEFDSKEAAIQAGQEWLKAKISETGTTNSDKH